MRGEKTGSPGPVSGTSKSRKSAPKRLITRDPGRRNPLGRGRVPRKGPAPCVPSGERVTAVREETPAAKGRPQRRAFRIPRGREDTPARRPRCGQRAFAVAGRNPVPQRAGSGIPAPAAPAGRFSGCRRPFLVSEARRPEEGGSIPTSGSATDGRAAGGGPAAEPSDVVVQSRLAADARPGAADVAPVATAEPHVSAGRRLGASQPAAVGAVEAVGTRGSPGCRTDVPAPGIVVTHVSPVELGPADVPPVGPVEPYRPRRRRGRRPAPGSGRRVQGTARQGDRHNQDSKPDPFHDPTSPDTPTAAYRRPDRGTSIGAPADSGNGRMRKPARVPPERTPVRTLAGYPDKKMAARLGLPTHLPPARRPFGPHCVRHRRHAPACRRNEPRFEPSPGIRTKKWLPG